MSVPSALLVVRGRLDGVRSWARRGLLPVWIVPGVAWTMVVPAGPPVSAPPYDDPVTLLGGRPVPRRLRPSMCFVTDGPRALVTVQQGTPQAPQRWLVWAQDAGLQRVEGLPHAPLGLVAELALGAAAGSTERRERLRTAVAVDGRSGAEVVDHLLGALSLPGAGLTVGALQAGDLPGAVRVDPDDQIVERFDAFVAHERELSGRLEDEA